MAAGVMVAGGAYQWYMSRQAGKMQMDVRPEAVLVHEPFGRLIHSIGAVDPVDPLDLIRHLQIAVVKLMTAQHCPDRAELALFRQGDFPVAEGPSFLFQPRISREQANHRRSIQS